MNGTGLERYLLVIKLHTTYLIWLLLLKCIELMLLGIWPNGVGSK